MLTGLHGLSLGTANGSGVIDVQPEDRRDAKRAFVAWMMAS